MKIRLRHLSDSIYRKQQGFTLTELALAFAVLGVGAVMIWQVIGLSAGDKARVKTRQTLERATYAVERYAQLHGRLPCPSKTISGVEDCTSGAKGFLPFISLGLPLKDAGSLEYELGQEYAPLINDHLSKYEVFYANSAAEPNPAHSLLASYPKGKFGLQDFCSELLRPSNLGAMIFKVRQNPAEFDGTGEIPLKIQSSRSQLGGKIGCGMLAVGGRSYFNVLSSARMMTRSINDYVNLVDTQTDLKIHGITQASVLFALSSWMLARTGSYIALAIDGVEDSLGANQIAVGSLAALGLIFAPEVVAQAGQASQLAELSSRQAIWKKQLREMEDVRDRTAKLTVEIESRAVVSASKSLFAIP